MTRPEAIKWLKAIVYVGMYGGLLMPLVFVPKVIFPFVFSKLLYFQIVIGLTFPAYLALAWVEPKFRPRWVPLYAAIVAYFVALALSTIFAVDPLRAWWGNQERMNGLFTLLHFLAWLTMMVSVLKTWEQWRKILLFEVGLSVFMAIVALLQIPFPKLLLFPAGPRVGGLLDNPIYMAAYQIFNLFFIVLLWLKGASKNVKVFLALAALFDIGAFVAAQSRGALLGLAAGIAVFAVAYAIMTPNRKARAAVLSFMALCVVSYGILYSFKDTDFVKHSTLARFTDLRATTRTRFIAWEIAWKGFLERPLTGWGFDDFHILFNQKYNPESLRYGYYETWFDRAHNTVMDVLAMTGLFGFVTFAAMYITLFYSVIRAYKRKWIDVPVTSVFLALPVAYFMQNLFVFDQPAGFTMSFFMFALIARATAAEFIGAKTEEKVETAPAKAAGAPRNVPWAAYGVIQVVMILVIWRTSVLPAKASYYTINSNNYFSGGRYPEALEFAKRAAAIPTPYLDEQTFLQSRNLMSLVENGILQKVPQWREWHDLVKDVTDRHLAEHPKNTHPHFIYARFLHAMSPFVPEDAAAAEREYLEAIRYSPKRQQLYYSLARFYLERGKKEEGYELFKQAKEFDPEVGESRWYAGLSLFYDLNRREEGAAEMVAAMNAASPYQLKSVQEAVALATAYSIVGDAEGMRKLITLLPSLSGGSVNMYLEIARRAEILGLVTERNLILSALSRLDPQLAPRLDPLLNGTATSIDASLELTKHLETQPTTTSATTTTAPTPVATTSGSGAGPRRQ